MKDRERKRHEHEIRKAEHDQLTTQQKIDKIVKRNQQTTVYDEFEFLGPVKGQSKRELARLEKQLQAEQAAKKGK